MCAAQAIDLLERRQLGHGTEAVYRLIREHVKPLTEDRPPAPDIEALQHLIDTGQLEEILNALS
jgi:histidine ammonia-lyase